MSSILQGINFPNRPFNINEIKALLTLNFRISIFFRETRLPVTETVVTGTAVLGEPDELVYHFVRDRRHDDKDVLEGSASFAEMSVTCVMLKSKIGDMLKLCGITKPFKEFFAIFQALRLTGNNILYFERTRVSVYPFDWYPCFEKDDLTGTDPRWTEIRNSLPLLEETARDLERMEQEHIRIQRNKEEDARRKQLEEQRRKEEEERLKREEDVRKREESRRKMEELTKTLIENSITRSKNDNPDSFAEDMKKLMGKKK